MKIFFREKIMQQMLCIFKFPLAIALQDLVRTKLKAAQIIEQEEILVLVSFIDNKS